MTRTSKKKIEGRASLLARSAYIQCVVTKLDAEAECRGGFVRLRSVNLKVNDAETLHIPVKVRKNEVYDIPPLFDDIKHGTCEKLVAC